MEEIEDHEHHGDLASQLTGDLLATQPVLQLEEPQHLPVPMGQYLAVEQDRVTQPRSALRQLRECASRLLQVAREELDATIGMMKLAAHTVVLLLGPDLVRAHPVEGLGRGVGRAREHEANRLEQGDGCRVQLSALAANSRLSNVTGDEVDAFDLGHGQPERLCNGGLYEAFAEADAHLARDDFDDEASGLWVQPAQERLEGRRLGRATRCSYRLQRLLDLSE